MITPIELEIWTRMADLPENPIEGTVTFISTFSNADIKRLIEEVKRLSQDLKEQIELNKENARELAFHMSRN